MKRGNDFFFSMHLKVECCRSDRQTKIDTASFCLLLIEVVYLSKSIVCPTVKAGLILDGVPVTGDLVS